MATRRRDALPGKEKASPSPKTGAARLKGVVNQISLKPKVSTAPQKETRPVASKAPASSGVSKAITGVSKAITTGVSKATAGVSRTQTRKPPSPATPSTPAKTRTRSLDSKTATPTHKTRVPTAVAAAAGAARRASSRLVKAVVSPKVVGAAAKKWKPVEKEEGKRRLSTSSSVGSGRRSSIGSKKESGCSDPATKEQRVNPERNEDLSICNLPESEMQLQDIEYSYLNEAADGIDDLVREDPTVRIAGSSTESPANNKTIEDNSRAEAKEKEVKVAPEEQAAVAVESKETEPAVETKQENSATQRQQDKTHGKYDSPVSNDVIEETANKLRENKANKVRALAGAFESVISSQDK
ncbi:neurofilament heavy polypeptide-like [Salvia hispanica]|uniref:neurofilament heavy polypeptide-like n=1 Tax=Salvia hispanica TaxID=49212 RepID=UPI002009BD5F|nr:neurofilament heavy polypeptide-like [Salvia hispanica]